MLTKKAKIQALLFYFISKQKTEKNKWKKINIVKIDGISHDFLQYLFQREIKEKRFFPKLHV